MSDTPLPVYVDARKAFLNEASIQGTIEVGTLDRVAACTADRQGQVQADLGFFIDSAGRRRVKGSASTRLMLTCQRCLEPVAADLEEEIDLVLVEDEEAAEQLDKKYDPWICEDHRIVLADLLDEQLLLGMPIVSVHASGPCAEQPVYQDREQEEADQPRRDNPFAVLADLKIERD